MVDIEEESFVFFKILLDDFKNKLILSEKVAAMSEKWSELKLRTALGDMKKKVWEVEIRDSDGMFYLAGDEWRGFVDDHDFQFGYFLVFFYCSDVTFYVVPFDLSGYRIAYDRPIIDYRHALVLVDDDDDEDDDDGSKVVVAQKPTGNEKKRRNLKLQNKPRFKFDLQSSYHQFDTIAGRIKMMKKMTVKKPQFEITIQPSYISKRLLNFPSLFCVANDLISINEVQISTNIGSWTVKFYHSQLKKGGIQNFLSTGLISFFRENNLKQGDVCIFKLLSKHEDRANFYVTKEDSKEVEFSRRGDSSNVSRRNISRKRGITDDDHILKMDKKKNTVENNLKIQKRAQFKINIKPTDGGNDRLKEQKMTKKMILLKPQFKIIIQPSYVKKGIMYFPNHFRDANDLQSINEVHLSTTIGSWTVNFCHSRMKSGGLQSFFSAGWASFRSENNLKQGDVCIFYLSSKQKNIANFYVEVSRSGNNSNVFERNIRRKLEFTDDDGNQMCEKKNTAEKNLKVQKRPQFKKNIKSTNGGDDDGRMRVQKMRKEMIVKKPQFEIIIQPSYISRKKMNFPIAFRDENGLRNTDEANLTTTIGRWTVRFCHYPSSNGIRSFFAAGWPSFCKENNIKSGDVCIFKLLSKLDNIANFVVTKQVKFSRMEDNSTVPKRNLARKIRNGGEITFDDKPKMDIKIKHKSQKNPRFKIHMQTSYSRYMHFPSEFRDSYDLSGIDEVILNRKGRLWLVSFRHYKRTYNLRSFFTLGWETFKRENNLKTGDVCTFELLLKKANKAIFLVKKKVIFSRKEDNSSDVQSRNANQPNYATGSRSLASRPHFEVKLKNSHFVKTNCMHIPVSFGTYFRGRSKVILTNSLSESWEVGISEEKRGTCVYHRLSKGWKEFCHDNKLEKDDVCSFELISEEGAEKLELIVTFAIHIS